MWEGVETQSKSQKNNLPKNKTQRKKEHNIQQHNIYAQLSIILMQQYDHISQRLKPPIIFLLGLYLLF